LATASENLAGWAVESITWTTDGVLIDQTKQTGRLGFSEKVIFGSEYARDGEAHRSMRIYYIRRASNEILFDT